MDTNTLDQGIVVNTLKKIGPQVPFRVVFRKKDGTKRILDGMMDHPKSKEATQEFPQAVPVMEIGTGQWRSFRVDSVLEITPFTDGRT